jgi:hypothetical protein
MVATDPKMKGNIECPLCLGQGELTRSEVLDRLGVKDVARIAQLSAEEAFRMLLNEHKREENTLWLRFETELTKRMNEVTSKHKNEIQALQTEKAALDVRLKEFQNNQDILLKNTKTSERLAVEKQMQDDIVATQVKVVFFMWGTPDSANNFVANRRVFQRKSGNEGVLFQSGAVWIIRPPVTHKPGALYVRVGSS